MPLVKKLLLLLSALLLLCMFSLRYRSVSSFLLMMSSAASSSSQAAAAYSSTSSSKAAAKSCRNNEPAALIFLHGLGDTPMGWSSLETTLPSLQPSLTRSPNFHYIFPQAPTIPISVNGGMKMTGWFDLYDWPIGVGISDDEEGMLRAVQSIEDEVQRLKMDYGIPKSRIVLGGFSQGGAVALIAAYYHNQNKHNSKSSENNVDDDEPYAGRVVLSGWLTLAQKLENNMSENAKTKTPLFWAHGQYDDKVLFEQQAHGLLKLRGFGIPEGNIQHEKYPMGHESRPKEMQDMAAFVHAVLFGDETEKNNKEEKKDNKLSNNSSR